MTDRRSETSRANLGKHNPEALSPTGTISIGTRYPAELVARIDAARGDQSRSDFIRNAVEKAVST